MPRGAALALSVWLAAASGCAGRPIEPAALDTANEACRFCRMAISDRRFAAQLAAPGEEPAFFDDVGCFRDYLADHAGRLPDGAVGFVADHRTGQWVEAASAVYTEKPGLPTPMATGLVAHRDSASRDLDPAATGGREVMAGEILGPLARKGRGPR